MFLTNEACLCLKVRQDLPLPMGVCHRSLPSGLLLLVFVHRHNPMGVCHRSLPSGLSLLVFVHRHNPMGVCHSLVTIRLAIACLYKPRWVSHRSLPFQVHWASYCLFVPNSWGLVIAHCLKPTGRAYVHRHKLIRVCHLPLPSSSSSLVDINPWGFLIAHRLKPTGLLLLISP